MFYISNQSLSVFVNSTWKWTYPDPDDANPSTRNRLELGEAPVSVGGNDRRNELRNTEGNNKGGRRPFHEEEAVRTGNENQGLRDHSHLEVDNRMKTGVVSCDRRRVQLDAKLVLEEIGLEDDAHQGNTEQSNETN